MSHLDLSLAGSWRRDDKESSPAAYHSDGNFYSKFNQIYSHNYNKAFFSGGLSRIPKRFLYSVQTSGPHGSMLITLGAVETMSSWRPFASTTVPECVRLPGQSKPEPLNGSQPVKLGRRSMQTPLLASGASMRSRVLNATAPTTQSVSSVPKVQSRNTFNIHSVTKSWFDTPANKRGPSFQVIICTFPTDGVNIQGNWGPWSDWSPCPALCEQVGVQLRSRICQSRSMPCSGSKVEGKACDGPECPQPGELSLV